MIHRFLFWLSGWLPCRFIEIDGHPYLERYGMPPRLCALFRGLGFTVYLHRFVSGDSERHVHDHPWNWSRAFVLTGRYVEERLTGFDIERGWLSRARTIRWYNRITGRDFHRITQPKPGTWTLFMHGPRTKTWGFLVKLDAGTLYHQPFDVARSADWEANAVLGRYAGREPFKGRE